MRYVVLVLVMVLAVGAVAARSWVMEAVEPVDPDCTESIMFEVRPGASSREVAGQLAARDLVSEHWTIILLGRWRGVDGQMQAGWYELSRDMSAEDILNHLVSGRTASRRFTLPEGMTTEQVVDHLVSQELGEPEVFNRILTEWEDYQEGFLAADYGEGQACEKYQLPFSPLEGYLLPGTYEISWGADETDIIERLISEMESFWTERRRQRAGELGLDIHEVLTLASLVEREARIDSERPKVASVFFNRLDIGMRLEACSTVAYALGDIDRNITRSETEIDTPYNTYRNSGLPPGPIANPGTSSIDAVLWPEETSYLYFVSRGDGTHAFSETFSEHLRNVNKYQP